MSQRWTDLAYYHWRYDPADVQSHLPDGVRVDTFDGSAWVGVVPFVMRDVRLGPSPPVPWLGTFVEINVRSYVIDAAGRRNVWFWSLDVPRTAIVGVARTVFSLPYCWSATNHSTTATSDGVRHRYQMTRRWPHRGATAEMAFTIGRPIAAPDDLDHFLTARWGLVTERFGRARSGRVHHPRWPLHEIVDGRIDETITTAAGLPAPTGEPHLRCSPGVPVEVAWFDRP